MSKPSVILPWKKTCVLRQEIRDRELGEPDFAVDLNKVIFGVQDGTTPPFYCDPARFFAMSYATANLRDFSSAVLRRLAGKVGGEAVINVSQTFGGGKSHTLAALYYLTTLGERLPRGDNTVETILNAAQLAESPNASVAAVSFDKVDWKKGAAVRAPTGEVRKFQMPWNLIAWQLLGASGLEILDRDETQPGYDTPPSDELWSQLLAEVEAKEGAVLILLDEFLMWAHDAASPDPTGLDRSRGPAWYERLKNFFQRLSQAVASSQRSCLVVSLLATEPSKVDEVGREILSQCNNGLGRMAQDRSPVEKDDLPELLRRRLFGRYPQSEAEKQQYVLGFWPRLEAMDPTRAKQPGARKKLIEAYPFHPDMLVGFLVNGPTFVDFSEHEEYFRHLPMRCAKRSRGTSRRSSVRRYCFRRLAVT
jgi:predicted AAA+ superfamily ATPase